jgi:hypothetical protein
VFIKISPIKSVLHFGKKGKLSLRYVGLFKILEWIEKTAYRVELPPQYSQIHNVFHVSILKMYVHDLSHIIQYENIDI